MSRAPVKATLPQLARISEQLRAEITRWVQCKVRQWLHCGTGDGAIRVPISMGSSGARGMPLPSQVNARIKHIMMAVITVSTKEAW